MSNLNEHGLTPQQEAFAQAVGSGMSGVEAYKKAYPKAKAWKQESIRVNSAKLLANTNVSLRVKQIQEKGAEIAGLDASKVLEELKRLVHSDIGNITHADGRMKLPHELDPATRSAVASFKIDEAGRIEYKFFDKNSAIEKAMKNLGLFSVDNKQKADPLTELLGNLNGRVFGPVKGE